MSYSVLHVTHLLAAIFFIGTLFVEVAVLSRVRQQIEPELMQRVDKAVGARLRVVLHGSYCLSMGPVSVWPGFTASHWQIHSPAASRPCCR